MYLSSGSWYRHNYGYSPTVVMVVGAAVVLAVVVITSMESEQMVRLSMVESSYHCMVTMMW